VKSLQYSIGDLEKITGIKAHTIRMWERRYDLIKPNRTKSNVRMYSQADMEKLQDVVLLYDKGVKISQIAGMCAAERASMLRELGASDDVLELRKDCFTASILEFNEEKLTTLLDNYEKRHGFLKTLTHYVWPFLENSPLLYVSGAFNLAHENFVNQVVKRKIMAHIDQIPWCDCGEKGKVMIYLPPGENKDHYTSGIEYICRSQGYRTLNMGMNIGVDELEAISRRLCPDVIVTMLDTDFTRMAVGTYLRKVRDIFPQAKMVVCGHQVASYDEDIPQITLIPRPADVINHFSD